MYKEYRFSWAIIALCYLTGCGAVNLTRQQGYEIAKCAGALPGDALDLAHAIIDSPPDRGSRILEGLLKAGQIIGEQVACALTATATLQRAEGGKTIAWGPGYTIYNRAAACGGNPYCRPEEKAAAALWNASQKKLIRLPPSGEQ